MPRFDALVTLFSRLVRSDGQDAVFATQSFTSSEKALGRMVAPRVLAANAALSALPVPAIILDGHGRFVQGNKAAMSLVGGTHIPASVETAAARAVRRGADDTAIVTGHPAGPSRALRVVPAEFEPSIGPAVVFLVATDETPSAVSPKSLRSRFGLTKQQAAVVGLVAQGLGNREVGERLNVSIETVRSHLKAAYPLLKVNSRSALVGVVYRIGYGR